MSRFGIGEASDTRPALPTAWEDARYGRSNTGVLIRRTAGRVTTSSVFGILLVSFMINVLATSKKGKNKVKITENKVTGAGSAVENSGYGNYNEFIETALTQNLPAWGVLLIVMTFLADNPTTGNMALMIAWLIFGASVLVNGEKAADKIGKLVADAQPKK